MKKQQKITKKSSQLKPIIRCRVCFSTDLLDIISLGEQKLSDFVEMKSKAEIPSYPLDLTLCNSCHLLQLRHTAPPVELYTDRYGYRSGINQTMKTELNEIVELAQKAISLKPNDIVVDIGANDGTLLSSYKPDKIMRVGFDPVKPFRKYFKKSLKDIDKNHYKLFSTFFGSKPFIKTFGKKKAKIVTAISMFYDLEDPNKFIQDILEILDKNGVLIIQQNYLVGMISLCAFDNIVHEHLEYYSITSLENLLQKHNLEIFDAQETPINGGSIRTFIRRKGSTPKIRGGEQRVKNIRAHEKQLGMDKPDIYLNFASRVNSTKNALRNFIVKEVKKGKTAYIYGASTRGNTIIQACEFDNTIITAAAERNTDKWGKKIASVDIPIISEQQARVDHPDYFLILPWFFREEFIEREREYLEKGGKMIFPLPNLELVYLEKGQLKITPLT